MHDIAALYGVYAARYVLPLITVPYLARVLGVAGWGSVAFAQSFGAYLMVVVEYGFTFSATREVARHRDTPERLSEIVAGVMGAKALLTLLCLAIAGVLQSRVPIFLHDRRMLWTAVFAGVVQSYSLIWLFQGLQRLKLVAALDIITKIVTTAGIFFTIHQPSDAWKVLLLQGTGSLIIVVTGVVIAFRDIAPLVPTPAGIRAALQMGWTMFLFRGAANLYTSGNSFVLGLFAPPQFVGYYAGAEKITRGFVSLLEPASQALYPRLSYLAHHSRVKAIRLVRAAAVVMGSGGFLIGIGIITSAPLLVRLLLGAGFAPAVPVLRLLALLPVLISLGTVFGIQWMLPLGMDRSFTIIILGAGLMNLGLAVALAGTYRHVGMAWAAILSETFVTAAMYLVLRKKGVNPLLPIPEADMARSDAPVANEVLISPET